jgi:hypothetical protein
LLVHENSAYIFGGRANGYSNDLLQYNFENSSLVRLVTQGAPPSARYGHASVIYLCSGAETGAGRGKREPMMFVFGGYDADGYHCNDLFAISLRTLVWREIKTLESGDGKEEETAQKTEKDAKRKEKKKRGVSDSKDDSKPTGRCHLGAVVHQATGVLYVWGGRDEASASSIQNNNSAKLNEKKGANASRDEPQPLYSISLAGLSTDDGVRAWNPKLCSEQFPGTRYVVLYSLLLHFFLLYIYIYYCLSLYGFLFDGLFIR